VYPAGSPYGAVVKAPDGTFYGTAEKGGAFARGSVYSMTPDGSGGFTFATLHSFIGPDGAAPRCALVFGSDGNLYGTTSSGGAAAAGTLFRIAPSGQLTRLHDFADGGGQEPTGVVFASDGALWGTTKTGGDHGGGTAYRLAAGDVFSVVHHFDGAVEGTAPVGGLLPFGGFLYGTTSAGGTGGFGTAFRIDLAGTVTTLHEFTGTDGSAPLAALIQATDGNLYGSTSQGGSGNGTIFRMDSLGAVTTLHTLDFVADGSAPSAPLFQAGDGQFYGTTPAGGGPIPPPPGGAPDGGDPPAGTVFRIDTLGNFQKLHAFVASPYINLDRGAPFAGLVDGGDGFLYGATWNSFGRVYRIDLAGNLSYVHLFGFDQGAILPIGTLAELGGKIYGTGNQELNAGTIFRLDAGDAPVLYTLEPPYDGRGPNGLLAASDGALYGTTQGGGLGLSGTIFRFTPPGTFEPLHAFNGIDGSSPAAGLIESPSGDLYGTTPHGGGPVGNGLGTVFHITTAGAFESLHTFDGTDGAQPATELVPTGDGDFYGTTSGAFIGPGTIFSMDVLGAVTTVHDFTGVDGATPGGAPAHASDGNFYGVTYGGGANNVGVLYRLDGTGTVTPLHDFTAAEGSGPVGTLVQASDGLLYGVAVTGGSQGFGTLFAADILGNVSVLHEFSDPDGRQPNPGLLVASDGAIYGTNTRYGFGGGGVVFRWWPSAVSPAPAAISPASGPASGGTPIVVSGDHLSAITSVSIGGVAATPPVLPDQGRVFSVSPPLPPGTLNDVTVETPPGPAQPAQTLPAAWFADFSDVVEDDIFHAYVETIFRDGITAGCGAGNYCRNDAVRRDQMAVFLLKAEHGSGYVPPPCTEVFPDVPCPSQFADWVDQLAVEGVTAGCGGGDYCPLAPVTRAQMAVFLLKTKEGSGYTPPPPAGIFGDVPSADSFAPWIEELYNRQITGGCQASPLLYCPSNPNTRGQMAVFLTKTFNLQ
jgi:uncharacterized repeat protein (TIGR03803 family)